MAQHFSRMWRNFYISILPIRSHSANYTPFLTEVDPRTISSQDRISWWLKAILATKNLIIAGIPCLWIVYYNLATYLWCPVDYCLKWKFATNADIVFRSTFIYTGVCLPIWMSSSSRNLLILWLADFYVGFIWVIHMYLSLNLATVTSNILHFLLTWGLFNITL